MTPQQRYISYLESETERLARRIIELEAAATILLIKLNLDKQTMADGQRLKSFINQTPEVNRLVKQWYNES